MAWKRVQLSDAELQASNRELAQLKKRSKFLVDENVDREVIQTLCNLGWNVKGTDETGLRGRSDHDVYEAARRDDRILLTSDSDFLDDRRFPAHTNPGVLILPAAPATSDRLADALALTVHIVGKHRETWRGVKIILSGHGLLEMRFRNVTTGRRTSVKFMFRDRGPPFVWESEQP